MCPQGLRKLASKLTDPLEIIEGFLWKLTQELRTGEFNIKTWKGTYTVHHVMLNPLGD